MTKLITGATGQIGSELLPALADLYGADNIIAVGHRRKPDASLQAAHYYSLDIRDKAALQDIVVKHRVDGIFHLAALLSAVAEAHPQNAWNINMNGLLNVLETAKQYQCSVFFPSSIGAFGPQTPKDNTPQDTIQRPNTIYGISKVSGELLCDYYRQRYGVDARGLRFPGLISYKTPPGGGTTDYAVEIFAAALEDGHYQCFLTADTRLDMMYMPDAIAAIIKLMQAEPGRLLHANAFNVTAMSFTPAELAAEINKHIPEFTISYQIDPVRQGIADSWPAHIDDSAARQEWGWRPQYDLPTMVGDMLAHLRGK
ncbi:NAD-dependent epimerase/dehydratase family protein [Methylomarinum sp. Ch1-1]|uniref:NAD-dependent epimerase/dehydratase family protein n=1 Tax=Methylomarinum roseum TaxID=3067653 RepID=A0AAU7NZ67_9GAMM|nr:NAD-dependent epimerase/dehydratase family protein [Methylomarinum sp. Ch1-1]MDP4521582.1 NAD-dependent epimerase/dehydratase family protein [Methylomarinum sp. Ch1-1]